MNLEDYWAIVDYWVLQDEIADCPQRSFEVSTKLQQTLATIAFIEMGLVD